MADRHFVYRRHVWLPSQDSKVTWTPQFFKEGVPHGALIVTDITDEWTAKEISDRPTGFSPFKEET
jgi:hypothetical protein